MKKAFFAFAGQPGDLAATIANACDRYKVKIADLAITPWPQMDIFGAPIADEIRTQVDASDYLIADITVPNNNVYYEIGYAIGRGKPVAPVLNVSFAEAARNIQSDGFFDTIGYSSYENADQLIERLRTTPSTNLSELYSKSLNTTQPLYLIDTVRKTDFRNAIVSAIKDAKVFYRSFDPVESYRFSTIGIISDISASSGVVIPLLATNIDDASRHNLRAAFLAGLSHGMGKRTIILQRAGSAGSVPADYRDLVQTFSNEDEVSDKVKEFCHAALVATQEPQGRRKRTGSKLQSLSLGASAAENEFRLLENYFVETSEFVRTQRGEVNVVSGRKGSGKTAIFFMVRDSIRIRKNTQVTDLKPESHQLSLFRQELLKLVDLGVFDHTLAAFWYFVFLTEILFTIRKEKVYRSQFDMSVMRALSDIDDVLEDFGILESGDFTSRINRLSKFIIMEITAAQKSGGKLSPEKLTNIVFRGGVMKIKQAILQNSDQKTRFLILFDNIDKGWPTKGVEEFDVRMTRLMVETLDKIRRDFDAAERNLMSVVFLRNDIYELLVEQTPDRGKAGQIRIDWNDPAKLRLVIYKRLQASTGQDRASFLQLWQEHFVPQVNGKDSFDYCLEHCLMRPRFLITIVENAIANAINRGNRVVQEEDIVDAVRQHANYLISEFGFEIRDASGLSADILFELIGLDRVIKKDQLTARFATAGVADVAEAFDLMLWYGVIGVVKSDGSEKFIYDYDYSIKRLIADARQAGGEANYVINSALMAAL